MATDRPIDAFATHLAEALRKRDWSNRQLADRTNLSPALIDSLVSAYRNHPKSRRPRRTTIQAIAQALSEPEDRWLKLGGYGQETDDDRLRRILGSKTDKLDGEDLAAVNRMVDALLIAKGYMDPDPTRNS